MFHKTHLMNSMSCGAVDLMVETQSKKLQSRKKKQVSPFQAQNEIIIYETA